MKMMLTGIKKALNEVGPEFYKLSYLNGDEAIKETHRERVFCYEFYHKMRGLNFISEQDVVLNAEVDKSGNSSFLKKIVPDFIFHKQGSNDKNLCVIEVKLTLDDVSGIRKDFKTLTNMMDNPSYQNGIFIIVNHGIDELKAKLSPNIINEYNQSILILTKENHRADIQEIKLGELYAN